MVAYNLIQQVIAEAALDGGLQPRQISFKGTLSTMTEMLPVLGMIGNPDELCDVLLAICRCRIVGN